MRIINIKPDRSAHLLLAALPFVLVALTYVIASALRLSENPADKLLPAFSTMIDSIRHMAFEEDTRTGSYLLWSDTFASASRLFWALCISTSVALIVGVLMGLLPLMGAFVGPFIAVASMVPPLALLPILFIVMGLGEASKIALIVIGTLPFLIRDLALRVAELPREQLIKAQTLGASTWQITLRIVVPQMLPRLIDGVRFSLGPAWLFLIAAEAIASDSGLGYRIFLMRRYLAMDVIIPYVAWITLLAYFSDTLLVWIQKRAFPWFSDARAT